LVIAQNYDKFGIFFLLAIWYVYGIFGKYYTQMDAQIVSDVAEALAISNIFGFSFHNI
jgi:hypothetical protein